MERNLPTIINGTAGDDILEGTLGIDKILGFGGNDVLRGNQGHDFLFGGVGNDNLSGGLGDDFLLGEAGNDLLNGDDGSDNLNGGAGNDQLFGGNGSDTLFGGEGTDQLYGGAGVDYFDGGAGRDTVHFQENFAITADLSQNRATYINDAGVEVVETLVNIENLRGTAFDDTLIGDNGNNWLWGNDGADYFDGGNGTDTVFFSNEKFAINVDLSQERATYINDAGVEVVETLINIENLVGSAFDDVLIGDDGNNVLRGNAGVDYFDGGSGIDTVNFFYEQFAITADLSQNRATYINDAGVEVVETLINIERLIGSAFDDTLIGDDGNNSLIGNAGADYFDGGDGIDTVSFLENFAITADLSQNRATYIDDTGVEVVETLINIENLIGAAFDDTLIGDNGNNLLRGEAGDDFLDGGDGIDTASFLGSQAGMIANLNQGTATSVNQTEVDTLVNIESLTGSNFDDHLIGDAANNTLWGLQGDDLLTGGADADNFNFGSSNQGIDTITDFNSIQGDQIRVSANNFGGGLTLGVLDAEEFTIGSAATKASDRFIYDDTTGALFFDPDGTGAIAQIQFAQLAVGVALTNSDIFAF
ncbi:MAG: calcium-binding protein [Symploca sp. SIO1B1]|nr:calcium-binding protein [Symploca sp. SIO1B1]